MKLLLIIALIPALALADDVKLPDGTVGTISRVEPDGIVVVTDSGISKISFSVLPKEIQKKYGYDQKAAAEHAAVVAKAQADLFQKGQQELIEQDREKKAAYSANEQSRQNAVANATPLETSPPTMLDAPASQKVMIEGKVIQRTGHGLLVECPATRHGKWGSSYRSVSGDIWLNGFDAQEDHGIKVKAEKVGTYEYETVDGAARMVDEYKAVP